MSRPIKFRALAKVHGKLPYWEYYTIMGKSERSNINWLTPDLQYTGLKDKNGKEIYEGDVMGLNGKAFYQVVWLPEAMFALADVEGNDTGDYDFSSYEVIGNIYSNPELLGGSHE